MPELPEVETIKRQVAPQLEAMTVEESASHPSAKFSQACELVGANLGTMRRRGKFLILPTDDERELVLHLGMTGKVRITTQLTEDKYCRAWWKLRNPKDQNEIFLEFSDVRRFGRIKVVDRGRYETLPTLHSMGPEPFDATLTADSFWKNLKRSNRKIKTQLLSQKPIAGVGNIYADEALWIAKINPKVTQIGQKRAGHLLDALKKVLQKGIDNGGTTLKDYRDADGNKGTNQRQLMVYGRSGEPCLLCGTELTSAQIDARTTTWCKNCQKR